MSRSQRPPLRRWLPVAVAAAVSAVNLWSLRATLKPVAYLDDASLHQQMVRYAANSIRGGRNPLTGWFPFLGEGSPHFLHYQSLGAMVTGLAGTVVGGNTAFRWSLWLLLGLWPLLIYASARIFRLSPWVAAAAAFVSPLLISYPSIGYERGAYVWIGYGVWSQLCASWTLPLAWATSWRAAADRRFIAPAAICVALTIGLHFETGYLAILGVIVFPWLVWTRAKGPGLRARVGRSAVVLACSGLMSAWVVIPLVTYSNWAGINEALRNSPDETGYGARTVLKWLFTGRVFDDGRLALVSVAVLIGVAVCATRWRQRPVGRALLVIGLLSLIVSFGRATFGSVADVVPASHDVFFRRFMMGAQLAGIYLAGIGLVAFGRLLVEWVNRAVTIRPLPPRALRWTAPATAAAVCLLVMLPAVVKVAHFDHANERAINEQVAEQRVEGAQISPLINYIRNYGGGRTYAGMPSNWGSQFAVGAVPVFKYLESQDIDEVGYTLRTASLMTTPEYHFNPADLAEYAVFGIRYLIVPTAQLVPPGAERILSSGPYQLWVLPGGGYFQVVDTIGSLSADRGHLTGVDPGGLVGPGADLTVKWPGAPAAPPTDPGDVHRPGPAGSVLSQQPDLVRGRASARVDANRRAVVMLSASYDPGWRVTVDGRRAPTEMLAPAVVGVTVDPGVHEVAFSYHGYPHYGLLAGVGAVGLALCLVVSFRGSRRRREESDRRPGQPAPTAAGAGDEGAVLSPTVSARTGPANGPAPGPPRRA